jgi:hypothetical protein
VVFCVVEPCSVVVGYNSSQAAIKESIGGLNWEAVRLTTVQVIKLSLRNRMGQKRHNLLCKD